MIHVVLSIAQELAIGEINNLEIVLKIVKLTVQMDVSVEPWEGVMGVAGVEAHRGGRGGCTGAGREGGRVTRRRTDAVAGVCRGARRGGLECGARLTCGRDGGQMRK